MSITTLDPIRSGIASALNLIEGWQTYTQYHTVPSNERYFVDALNASFRSMLSGLDGDVISIQEQLGIAQNAITSWQAVHGEMTLRKVDGWINRNDISGMYDAMLFSSELLVNREQIIVQQRLELLDSTDHSGKNIQIIKELSQVRTLRACCETLINLLGNRPFAIEHKIRVAIYEAAYWREV
jgi:hypothetical protein